MGGEHEDYLSGVLLAGPTRGVGPAVPGRRLRFTSPAQAIVAAFGLALLSGTAALMLPEARVGPGGATFLEALFTATSAVCVTGLAVVDTGTYWTPFGQAVILALIQVGGFGIMTFASLIGLLAARRLGLRTRLSTAAEVRSVGFGDLRQVLKGVGLTSLLIESVTAVVLTLRFALGYDAAWPHALWLGVFHAVSAFNNAGFGLFSDSLVQFATDPWIILPICLAVILGGLGFPVILELRREIRTSRLWSLTTRIVLLSTVLLLVAGTTFFAAVEWRSPTTLGPLDVPGKLLAAFTQGGVMPRTAGFNSLDISQLHPVTWLGTDILMFIGAGPAGTAGGLKVTTFAVLFAIIWTELRGEGAVNLLGKRLPRSVHRQALSVALLATGIVVVATMTLMLLTDVGLDRTLFEAVSAFATVGLSTGITAQLPAAGQVVLVVLMFVGRLGPVTLGTALALRRRHRLYELPRDRPLIG